jgi:hypothetical protein
VVSFIHELSVALARGSALVLQAGIWRLRTYPSPSACVIGKGIAVDLLANRGAEKDGRSAVSQAWIERRFDNATAATGASESGVIVNAAMELHDDEVPDIQAVVLVTANEASFNKVEALVSLGHRTKPREFMPGMSLLKATFALAPPVDRTFALVPEFLLPYWTEDCRFTPYDRAHEVQEGHALVVLE